MFVCGGVPQTQLLRGEDQVPGSKGRPKLEAKAVAAQRAYIDALVVWERLLHQASCSTCRPSDVSVAEQERRCAIAETRKERLRIAFRDLCYELGYVPRGHGIALPDEDQTCCHCSARGNTIH